MGHDTELIALLLDDPLRMEALTAVARIDLPDGWIGAGFVRDAVWDHLHGYRPSVPRGDVDVVWFSAENIEEEVDRQIERRLCGMLPGLQWSVKNQARMHLRNGDAAYSSVADAMSHWPETATAVAVANDGKGSIRINAPLGLEDLYAPRLRPTADFRARRRDVYDERVKSKDWIARYPLLRGT